MNMDIKNWNLEDSCDDTQFYYECVNNNDMIACIVMPHKDNNYNYILRVGFKSTFNKWGDVEFEENLKHFYSYVNVWKILKILKIIKIWRMMMNKGCIIIGYQGIGKSSTVKETRNTVNHFIDLESSCWKDSNGYRSDDWYVSYCNIALDLAKQGNIVFTASHKVVRDYLLKNKEDVEIIVIFPSIELKDKWIDRLENRYVNTNLDKDMFAFLNAKDMYEENIHDLEDYSWKIDLGIKIINIDYNLLEILKEYNIVN